MLPLIIPAHRCGKQKNSIIYVTLTLLQNVNSLYTQCIATAEEIEAPCRFQGLQVAPSPKLGQSSHVLTERNMDFKVGIGRKRGRKKIVASSSFLLNEKL